MGISEEKIQHIIHQFNHQTLPKEKWTHQAHIIVAFWYAQQFSEEEALAKLTDAIKNYNISVGTENTDTSGYHETLTVFWLKLVKEYLEYKKDATIEDAINTFLLLITSGTGFPLIFYSGEVLFSKEARHHWVTPNKLPLCNFKNFFEIKIGTEK
ncbi:MAG: hypothetical protein KBA33_03430 [Cloacibacterium sp.]|nr:hypothetical protein [Cloacibacterium sp.]